MKLHQYTPRDFISTDLLAHNTRDAYAEASHLDLLFQDTQHQLHVRSRQIVALAMRRFREAGSGSGISISDGDAVKFVDLLSDSLQRGTNGISGFSRESQLWLQRVHSASSEHRDAWLRLTRELVVAAETEVSFGSFVLFQLRCEEATRLIQFNQTGALIEKEIDGIAESATEAFLNMCRITGGMDQREHRPTLHKLIRDFLRHLVQLLKFGCFSEIRLNIVRYFSEFISTQIECSDQEWEYFIRAIEHQIVLQTNARNTREIKVFFEDLVEGRIRFTLSGIFFRNLEGALEKISTLPVQPRFFCRDVLSIVIGETILGSRLEMSPLAYRMTRREGPLTGEKAEALKMYFGVVVNHFRSLMERSWLDLLEDGLGRLVATAAELERQSQEKSLVKAAIEQTAVNLRQGLAIFQGRTLLERDLDLVLETARHAILLHGSASRSRSWFKKWFAYSFAIVQANGLWGHARTQIRALRTSLNQTDEGAKLVERQGEVFSLLEDIPSMAEEARFVIRVIPFVTVGGLNLSKRNIPTSLAEEVRVILRTSLIDFLVEGPFSAPVETLKRLTSRWLETDFNYSEDEVGQSLKFLTETITEIVEFKSDAFYKVWSEVVAGVPRAITKTHLWRNSRELAIEIVDRVYTRMAGYGEAALQAPKNPRYDYLADKEEYKKSARTAGKKTSVDDVQATLRQMAIALSPEVSDPRETMNIWWQKMINPFVVTRPAPLFLIAREEMVRTIQNRFGRRAGALTEEMARAVYDNASTEGTLNGDSFTLENWDSTFPLEDSWSDDFGLQETLNRCWNAFLSENEDTHSRSGLPLNGEQLDGLLKIIGKNWVAYEWSGLISRQVSEATVSLLVSGRQSDWPNLWLGYLHKLLLGVDDVPEWNLKVRLSDYIEALKASHLNLLSGEKLIMSANEWSQEIIQHIFGSQSEWREEWREGLQLLSKSLPNLLQTMGRALKEERGVFVDFCWIRLVMEQVNFWPSADHPDLWKQIWGRLAASSAKWMGDELEAPATSLFGKMYGIAEMASRFLGISKRFSKETRPSVFSANPYQEKEWTHLVLRLCELSMAAQVISESELKPVYGALVNDLDSIVDASFETKLEKVQVKLLSWAAEQDRETLRTVFVKFASARKAHKRLQDLFDQNRFETGEARTVSTRRQELLPKLSSADWLTFDLALARLEFRNQTTSAFGLPAIITFMSPRLLSTLAARLEDFSSSDWEDILGPGKDVFHELIDRIGSLFRLKGLWSVTRPGAEAGAVSEEACGFYKLILRRVGMASLAEPTHSWQSFGDWLIRLTGFPHDRVQMNLAWITQALPLIPTLPKPATISINAFLGQSPAYFAGNYIKEHKAELVDKIYLALLSEIAEGTGQKTSVPHPGWLDCLVAFIPTTLTQTIEHRSLIYALQNNISVALKNQLPRIMKVNLEKILHATPKSFSRIYRNWFNQTFPFLQEADPIYGWSQVGSLMINRNRTGHLAVSPDHEIGFTDLNEFEWSNSLSGSISDMLGREPELIISKIREQYEKLGKEHPQGTLLTARLNRYRAALKRVFTEFQMVKDWEDKHPSSNDLKVICREFSAWEATRAKLHLLEFHVARTLEGIPGLEIKQDKTYASLDDVPILKPFYNLNSDNSFLRGFMGCFRDPDRTETSSWDDSTAEWSKERVLVILLSLFLAKKNSFPDLEQMQWLSAEILLLQGVEVEDLDALVGFLREKFLDQDLSQIHAQSVALQGILRKLVLISNLSKSAPDIVKQLADRVSIVGSLGTQDELVHLLTFLGKEVLIDAPPAERGDRLLGALRGKVLENLLKLNAEDLARCKTGITNCLASKFPTLERVGDYFSELKPLGTKLSEGG